MPVMESTPELPLISMIVAVRNGAGTIQRCIDSFVRQSYRHKELLVMDGVSTDGTVALLWQNAGVIDYWRSEKDRGLYHAWNKALDHAKGDWICFLGADDYFWDDEVLERVAAKVSLVYPRHRVAYGRIHSVKEDGEILESVGGPWEQAGKTFSQKMSIPHQGVFHHRTLFEDHGGFDETFQVAGDYDLLLRELKEKDAYFLDDIVVAGMQRGGITGQPEHGLSLLREIERARGKNGISGSKLIWRFHFARSLSRAAVTRILGKRAGDVMADFYRLCTGKPRMWTR